MAGQMVRSLRLLKVALALAIIQGAPVATANDACRIAVLGDSLTSAYGLAVEEGFPAQLERALRQAGHDCAVLDAGVGGDTTAGGLARLEWTLADRPSHVIVELGGNDGLRALPPEQMEQNLDAIVSRLQADGVAVLLAGMLCAAEPRPDLRRRVRGSVFRGRRAPRRAALPVLSGRGRRQSRA